MDALRALKATLVVTGLLLVLAPAAARADGAAEQRCRSYVQGRIDMLDAELHKGTRPNEAQRLVKRRDKLRAQLARCDRDPKAWQKDI